MYSSCKHVLRATVAAGLVAAALPLRIFPPLFNSYAGGQAFGVHVDNAVRIQAGTGLRVRSDLSITLFLERPEAYEGGELTVETQFGVQQVKLPAGDLVVYAASSLHQVTPVTRGTRLASFFWTQSMVRSDEQRRLLYDMDMHLMQLRGTVGETDAAVIGLTATYHNLLRMWIDV